LARLFQSQGNTRLAAYHRERIAVQHADDMDSLLQVVRSLVKMKEFERAGRIYEMILALDEENLEFRLQYIRCSLIAGWDRLVLRETEKMLSMLDSPERQQSETEEFIQEMKKDVFRIRGLAFLSLEDHASALESLRRALALQREEEDLHIRLSYLEALARIHPKESYAEAAALVKAIDFQDPESGDTIITVIGILLDSQGVELAMDVVRALLSARPDAWDVYREVAITLSVRERYEDALAVVEEGMEKFPGRERLRLLRAGILFESGRKGACYAAMKKWIRGKPETPVPYLELARFYSRDGNYTDALKILKKADKQLPDNMDVLFQLASTHERVGESERAESLFHRILQRDPYHAPALNYLGYLLADKNVRLEESKEYIRRALEIDPENGAYLDSLGWVNYRLGLFQEAEAALLRAIDRIHGDAIVYEHLGDVYFGQGNYRNAILYFEKARDAAGSGGADALERKIRDSSNRLQKEIH
jgi:tetratricopeptide (TPR) repeat protein